MVLCFEKSNISFLIRSARLRIAAFMPVHRTAASFLSTAVILTLAAASARMKLRTPDPEPRSAADSMPRRYVLFSSRYSANAFK